MMQKVKAWKNLRLALPGLVNLFKFDQTPVCTRQTLLPAV